MNEEIKAASVDSEAFRSILADYYIGVQNKDTRGVSVARDTLIAHINAWSDERANAAINQLAASGAVSTGVVPSLTDEQIDRQWAMSTTYGGDTTQQFVRHFARAILALVTEHSDGTCQGASPVAGWVSVEDAKDVVRYRWLREQDWFDSSLCVLRDPKRVLTKGIGLGADCPSHHRLDAAIDEAMTAPPAPAATPTQQQEQS